MAKPLYRPSPPALAEVKQQFPLVRVVSGVPGLSQDTYLFSPVVASPLLVFLPISFGPDSTFEVAFTISVTGSVVPNGFMRQQGDSRESLDFVEQMVSLNRSRLLAILRRGPEGNYRIKVLSTKKDYLEINPSETNPQMQNLPHHYAIQVCEAMLQRTKEQSSNSAVSVPNFAELLKQTIETFASREKASTIPRFELYRLLSSFSSKRQDEPTRLSRTMNFPLVRLFLFTMKAGWWPLALWLAAMPGLTLYIWYPHYPHYDKGLQLAERGSYLAAAREFKIEVDRLNLKGEHDMSILLQPALMYRRMGDEKSEFRALKEAFQYIGPKTSEKYDQALPPEMRDAEIGAISCGKEQGIRLMWVRYRTLQKKFLP